MEQVKSLTGKPVKYVLNTHQHEDHAGGNAKMLGASAEVVAHRNVRGNMVGLSQPGLPRVTFSDEMDINLGGREVVARHYGRGHTGGDAVIYFPARKVIHTGDLFLTNPPQPFIDYANGGSALEWTSTLDEVLKLDFDIAIPGHGPVSDRAGLMKFRSNFETMRNRIGGMVRGGGTNDEVAKTLVTEFGWAQGGLAVQQVDSMIAELKQ
jgi:glyoxylase-like metal-dependent hydrolase (beta-lactamase superfamily II)